MKNIDINNNPHDWEKQNLVTISDRKGSYDSIKCKLCGMKGKRRSFNSIEVAGTYSDKRVLECIKDRTTEGRVKVIRCETNGHIFSNLTPGSEHDIVPAPKGVPDNLPGVWVPGIGEPVKLLEGEYELLS